MATESDTGSVDEAVAAAAAELYAVPLADFVASRKALAATAKASGGPPAAKAVLALRKPTLTAWAMNLVPRGDAATLTALVGLGARMRAAQSRLDTATLTSVRGERDAALTAYVDAVATAAKGGGGSLSVAGRDEVRASAIAALADESAAQALISGQLTRALTYSGFGEVDLSGAVGVTSSGTIMSVLRGGALPRSADGADRADGADGADGAEGTVDADEAEEDDELTAEELARAVAEARAAKAQARVRAEERRVAQSELTAAESEMRAAQTALDTAEQAARTARRAVVDAQSRLDAARSAVARLPPSGR